MPIKTGQQVVRRFKLSALVMNGDGSPHDETLEIVHRPVTEIWVNAWNEITARETEELRHAIEELQTRVGGIEKERRAELQQQAKEAAEKNLDFDFMAAERELQKELRSYIEETQEKLRESKKRSVLIRQLACDYTEPQGLLFSIDHIDEHGQQIAPTQEFLSTLDLALLEEAKETIEKKAFASRLTS